jgi:hypothetical protein
VERGREDEDVDMTSSRPLHIVPNRLGSWHVRREGQDQPLSEHNSETEAELAAVRTAHDTDASEVLVHDRYDRVRPCLARTQAGGER